MFKNMVCILALLGLATVLATFQKIGQFLFQIIWSPCSQVTSCNNLFPFFAMNSNFFYVLLRY
jgi:hypothetical protein